MAKKKNTVTKSGVPKQDSRQWRTAPQEPEYRDSLNILVVGDWVIDDDWLVGSHSNPTSSAPANAHFRSLVGRERLHLGVCGAGRVVRPLLHNRQSSGHHEQLKRLNILGIGLWAKGDGDQIKELLEADPDAVDRNLGQRSTHYRLSPIEPEQPTGRKLDLENRINLFNLADAIASPRDYLLKECGCNNEPAFTTARVVRIFEKNSTDRLSLVRRFDWDRPIPNVNSEIGFRTWPLKNEYRSQVEDKLVARLKSEFGKENNARRIDAVIVKCLARGVMSDDLVQILLHAIDGQNRQVIDDRQHTVDWFVSSKLGLPPWLDLIRAKKNHHLRSVLFPGIALRKVNQATSWFVDGRDHEVKKARCLSRDAFEHVESTLGKLKQPVIGDVVLFQPNGLKTIALCGKNLPETDGPIDDEQIRKKKQWQGVCQPIDGSLADIGAASVFFASVCEHMLSSREIDIQKLGEIIVESTLHSEQWQADVESRIKGELTPTQQLREQQKRLELLDSEQNSDAYKKCSERINEILGEINDYRKDRRAAIDSQLRDIDWSETMDRWHQAVHTNDGIIDGKSGTHHRRIELWRGASALTRFVSVSTSKRRSVSELIQLALKSKKSWEVGKTRNKSCMVVAPPGSGKTTLVRGVASTAKMSFLPVNMTELYNRSDLLGCFDQIVTQQTQTDAPLLVLIDEINAKVGGQHVHDRFLAPLEDGYFSRDGKRFILRPCLWVFADTTDPRNLAETHKMVDFCSRLSNGFVDLEKSDPIEFVYIGLHQLRSRFPHLQFVEKGIIDLLSSFAPNYTMRDLRHLIYAMVNDQGGDRVSFRNLPENIDVRESGTLLSDFSKWLTRYRMKFGSVEEDIEVIY